MGDKCKGCGAGSTKESMFVAWNCGSIINESGFARSDACYEAEIRTLREMLGGTEKLFKRIWQEAERSGAYGPDGETDEWCSLCSGYPGDHKEGCLVIEIDALLARIQAMGKE